MLLNVVQSVDDKYPFVEPSAFETENNKGYDKLRKFDLTRNIIKSVFISPNGYELNSNEWAINSNIVKLKN